MDSRAVSEDGSRIVFTTAEPLSAAATNGLANVYEWHEEPGLVKAVCRWSRAAARASRWSKLVISPSGGDVFFVTSQGSGARRTPMARRMSMTRGWVVGFPAPARRGGSCAGDACQGPLTNPAPLLVPGSVSQAPGGTSRRRWR